MEDVLDVYQRSYDPSRPVVCIDETNKQLIIEKRVPCKPGEPEKLDSVYVRNGVADIFMISEPLAGKRETVVKQTRTAIDFAEITDENVKSAWADYSAKPEYKEFNKHDMIESMQSVTIDETMKPSLDH